MSIKVSTSSTTTNVKIANNKRSIQTTVSSGIIMPRVLNELLDVDTTNSRDKYVIMYNESVQKYVAVNPDEVLSASSTTELTSPGLPTDFKNQLDTDLDNRIDLDAGSF